MFPPDYLECSIVLELRFSHSLLKNPVLRDTRQTKRKEGFIEQTGNPGEKVDSCPRAPTPRVLLGNHRERRKGLRAEESAVGCVVSSWTFF